MDVTEEYLAHLTLYGGGDYTGSDNLVGSNSLVYAQGPSMQRAIEQTVTTIPFEFNYQGNIGLMGAENIFFKIKLDIKDTGLSSNCFEEDNWECLSVDPNYNLTDNTYEYAVANLDAIEGDEPTYNEARFTNELPFSSNDTLIGIKLTNEGTDNIYENANVDSRLYSKCRFEHGYDDMLVGINDSFYVGIHSRNTKQNAYNVKCKVGTTFKSPKKLNSDDKRLIAHCP